MIHRRHFLSLSAGAAFTTFTRAAAEKPRRLLLVHGRAQGGKNPEALKKDWLDTLTKGLQKSGLKLPEDLQVDFPFYGDVLDDFVKKSKVPLTTDIQVKGDAAQNDDFLAFQAEVAEEMRVQAGVTIAEVDAEYGKNPKPKGPQNWEWVQAILRALDKKKGFTQSALEQFMRDVYLYVKRTTVRDAIDDIVRQKVTAEPTVVVGHSLGSVVALHVLLSADSAAQFPLYVTVGSPLAIRPIRSLFEPLTYPAGLKSWYNAYDKRDVVALYALDARNFAVSPEIENYDKVRNSTDNRHGIAGYLDDKLVAEKILRAL